MKEEYQPLRLKEINKDSQSQSKAKTISKLGLTLNNPKYPPSLLTFLLTKTKKNKKNKSLKSSTTLGLHINSKKK